MITVLRLETSTSSTQTNPCPPLVQRPASSPAPRSETLTVVPTLSWVRLVAGTHSVCSAVILRNLPGVSSKFYRQGSEGHFKKLHRTCMPILIGLYLRQCFSIGNRSTLCWKGKTKYFFLFVFVLSELCTLCTLLESFKWKEWV